MHRNFSLAVSNDGWGGAEHLVWPFFARKYNCARCFYWKTKAIVRPQVRCPVVVLLWVLLPGISWIVWVLFVELFWRSWLCMYSSWISVTAVLQIRKRRRLFEQMERALQLLEAEDQIRTSGKTAKGQCLTCMLRCPWQTVARKRSAVIISLALDPVCEGCGNFECLFQCKQAQKFTVLFAGWTEGHRESHVEAAEQAGGWKLLEGWVWASEEERGGSGSCPELRSEADSALVRQSDHLATLLSYIHSWPTWTHYIHSWPRLSFYSICDHFIAAMQSSICY